MYSDMEAPNSKHQITNKFQSPKFEFPPHPFPLPLGRGWGEGCLGHLKLGIGAYLEFGICDLGFRTLCVLCFA
jgi:hypothetical protein